MESRVKHVAIIGSGPAGLAVAAGLSRRGVNYTVLERGDTPVAALRAIDPDMALFSPAPLSRLRGMQLKPAARYPTFRELIAALDRFRVEHAIEVRTGAAVTGVERTAGGFVVHAAGGAVEASHVVSATGIASAPRLPADLDRAQLRMRWLHSRDVRRADVAAARRLLVVGAGASAADVLEHHLAVRRDGDRAWIATRSPIRAMRSSLLGIDMHYWLWALEHLPGRRFGPKLSPKDPMWGKQIPQAIARGVIEEVRIAAWQGDRVVLENGAAIEPDLVVFATGFAHDIGHLGDLVEHDAAGWPIARRCESVRTPGVYVLGARYARSLASPYLRGIARDAEAVAARIAKERERA
jgi:putative flavoprotein involved in K+ transport